MIGCDTVDVIDYVPRLISAGLSSDRKLIETVALTVSRKLKMERPDLSEEIAKALALSGTRSAVRSVGNQVLPVDRETRMSLVDVEEPTEVDPPILTPGAMDSLHGFIRERELMQRFYEGGIEPSNSVLFTGRPGVGKTYTAHWIAYMLDIPLISLNLATSISSYLGRSGQNIKSIFDYAKAQPTILFLDEFDAIAKRRDDESDLGELKRLVNVLLKEIESCPKSSVILAATNHPELLDRAMWRRFDRVLELDLPGVDECYQLLERHLPTDRYQLSMNVRSYMSKHCIGISAADICKLCEQIKRQAVMDPSEGIDTIALKILFERIHPRGKSERARACKALKRGCPKLTTREIAEIVGASAATVSRDLKEVDSNAR